MEEEPRNFVNILGCTFLFVISLCMRVFVDVWTLANSLFVFVLGVAEASLMFFYCPLDGFHEEWIVPHITTLLACIDGIALQ